MIKYFLNNRLVTVILLIVIVVWGISVSPFDWHFGALPRDPVAVDAIPDIGDNQQIVATEWMGRSPKDIQDQITYPLTTALLGIPGVKTIRSTSMFGMSFIYIIFDDKIEFYWSRSRVLEKLNSLQPGTLPEGVQPTLGPDATALGQIFWYTLEGRNPETGEPTGGWDAEELRTVQDFYVKYVLSSAEGVSEVASIGGFVKEYQVEINPDAMRAFDVSVMDIMNAVKKSNLDIGAETIEMNKAEYLVRGLGYIKNVADLEEAVVTVRNSIPVRIRDVAFVTLGPATRRGGLDKEGVEAVGAVVVARYGSNPMAVIDHIKEKIVEMDAGLPQKVLPDGTVSKVTVVPFYDRSGLIRETIGTLETALSHEILICIIVVIAMVFSLRASLVISSILPIAVLSTFIIMRYTGIEANIVALSGIAIAIGVMVDVGVVIVENILRNMSSSPTARGTELIYKSVKEVSGALITGMLTTIISFLPVFTLQAQEGKLFGPLAYTKTFALLSALALGFMILPALAYYVQGFSTRGSRYAQRLSEKIKVISEKHPNLRHLRTIIRIIVLVAAVILLTEEWLPVGTGAGFTTNFIFVVVAIGAILGILWLLVTHYERILRWCLSNRWTFMLIPLLTLVAGAFIWRGMGEEFMPTLDEGSFLLMPTSMPHTGIEQNLSLIETIDRRVSAIPEVDITVGKWGRVNSALDPAPVQMFENTINYRPEYMLDANGHRQRFKVNGKGAFLLTDGTVYQPEDGFRLIPADSLIPDNRGNYFRQWRPQIKRTDDIWQEIINVSHLPGLTSSPKLQPIEARLVMLSTGMRAAMGLKVTGPDLESIEEGGKALEATLKEVPSVLPSTVFYDRAVGAPYIEIQLNRRNMARYGITVADLQEVISAAVGGMSLTTTVEGRERFPVRLRYPRELRDNPEALSRLIIPTATGVQIPLGDVADIEYTRGAQMIQSENTFLTGYVIFDKLKNEAEVNVVHEADKMLKEKIRTGELKLPKGVSYKFAGNYEQQQRASDRLLIVIPLSLLAILLVLYFRFRTVTASLIHFSGVFVAFAGGFILLWLYAQPWFMNFTVGGENVRDLFQMHPVNLSIAVWVGFIALFGISTNDGVLMGTYIHDTFEAEHPSTREGIREAVVHAGLRRVRPAAMTTATALIALLPVLTSTGKGSDIMIPMAIPTFGGMLIQSMTMFVVPVLQCWWREGKIKKPKVGKAILPILLLLLVIPPLAAQNNDTTPDDGLSFYLKTAAENNQGVKAAFLTYQASLQKIPQAGAIADPTLEMGAYLEPMDIVGGRQLAQFQLMQMFPWFGTTKAARTEAQHMAKMAYEQFREARDNVYLEVYTQWYVLSSLQQKLANTKENIQLLKQLETLSVQKYTSGGSVSGSNNSASGGGVASSSTSAKAISSGGMGGMGMGSATSGTSMATPSVSSGSTMSSMGGSSSTGLSEVLLIQIEIAESESSTESIFSEIKAAKARFNTLLNCPANEEVSVSPELTQLPFIADIESALLQATDQNPMLGMIREESLAYEAKAVMDKKMGYPMFGIGFQYMLIGKTPEAAMDPMDAHTANQSSAGGMNGKDMLMPMISVSIPLYRSKYKAAQKETQLLREATEAKYADAVNQLQASLYRTKHDLDDASRKIALYKKQSSLTRTTYDLLIGEFVSGRGSLSEILQVQRQLLDFRLKESDAIADYNTQVAAIQKIISSLHSD
ncbi:hypothetical protein AGMMS49574_07650 [Bacteroidia bacterium]|nr:hypothetical protein AGMMS49574_07650 [Bacteroidia bacterium]